MRKIGGLLGVILLSSQILNGQVVEEDEDSEEIVHLENVVITGQYSAQSVNKSLYQVEVISADDIKNQAANTIADILNQNLNIQINSSSGSGDSQITMMGLDGSYVKVLIDNIPLVSDSGFGNNIDLTKINLDNVERIEIVKGSMGVDYGNNALAGIINIITKKSAKSDWKINFMVQEETVGSEYDWYEDGGVEKGKGRHIQALDISKRINNNWYVNAGVNRNDFQGFWGDLKGRKYFEQDQKRGYEWLPKEQWNSYGSVSFKKGDFSAFYKVSYLQEDINRYDSDVKSKLFSNGERTYFANDRDYATNRWTHHLNLNAKLFDRIKYNGDFSYQIQERKFQDYEYDIPTRKEILRKEENTYFSTKSYYSRGTFSNFIHRKNFDFQVGYELDFNKGFANAFADTFVFKENLDKEVGTYAGFASAEIHFNSGLSVRPGVRATFSNLYDPEYSFSLSSKYNLTENSSIRAVIGTANRFPNFSELYTYQVDSNHEILGNPNLKPENGYSTSIQWNKNYRFGDFRMENNISTLYLDLDDKIDLVNLGGANYLFMNIDKYKTWGISTENKFSFRNLVFTLGASYFGQSQTLNSQTFSNTGDFDNGYIYHFQGISSLNYRVPSIALTMSTYYKYTGKSSQYVLDPNNLTTTDAKFILAERDDFHMLDASIRKGFYKDRFEVTLGARNLLDVTSINDEAYVGQGHTGTGNGNVQLYYGRSYFLKLVYNLEF